MDEQERAEFEQTIAMVVEVRFGYNFCGLLSLGEGFNGR